MISNASGPSVCIQCTFSVALWNSGYSYEESLRSGSYLLLCEDCIQGILFLGMISIYYTFFYLISSNTKPCCTSYKSPTDQTLFSIESSPKLSFWLYHLALQDGKFDYPLTVLWPHSCQPDTLPGLAICIALLHSGCCSSFLSLSLTSINHYICREFMPANMADEVYTYPARPIIVQIPEKSQWPEVALEFPAKERGGLAAACIAGSLRAKKDQIVMGARAGGKWRYRRNRRLRRFHRDRT